MSNLREELAAALENGAAPDAIQLARQLVETDDSIRTWSHIRKAFDKHPDLVAEFKPLRVALLSSFSIEFVHDPLVAAGYLEGVAIEIYQSGFNQFRQDLLNPASALAAFKPDVTFLGVEGEQLVPSLYEGFLDASTEDAGAAVDAAFREIQALVEGHANVSNGLLAMHDLIAPRYRSLGVLDGGTAPGQVDRIQELNGRLRELSRERAEFFVTPYAALVERIGRDTWFDARMRHYAKAPVSQRQIPHLARLYMSYVRSLTGRTRKCLVVDLDHTMWGGILGEDGPDGIALGPNYPGSAFVEFQKAIAELARRGIVLAVASKNNRADVLEVMESHPHMVLREKDFATMEIHWDPKSQSIQNIANSLNLGLDHIVFVDDNPAECTQVRRALPQVTVIQMPKRPEEYVDALLRDGLFDGLSYSAEDRKRAGMYRQRAQAEELRSTSVSLDSYYESLEMVVSIEAATDATAPRTSQLTQKTNQFNLTTIRHDEAAVRSRMADPNWLVTTVQVEDRFGDNGIVGIMMAEKKADGLEVETFLLSCRVIGRTIETAMIAWLAEQCAAAGLAEIRGEIRFTKKNVPARDLYERHGFACVDGAETEQQTWVLKPGENPVDYPSWLSIRSGVASE